MVSEENNPKQTAGDFPSHVQALVNRVPRAWVNAGDADAQHGKVGSAAERVEANTIIVASAAPSGDSNSATYKWLMLESQKKTALSNLNNLLKNLPPAEKATLEAEIKMSIDGAENIPALKKAESDMAAQIELAYSDSNTKENLADGAMDEREHKKEAMLRIVEELHTFNEKMDTILDALEDKLTPEEKKARDEAKADLKAKEEELKRIFEDPNSTEEERNAAFKRLMISQNHLNQIDKPVFDRLAQSPDPAVREQAREAQAILEANAVKTDQGNRAAAEQEAKKAATKQLVAGAKENEHESNKKIDSAAAAKDYKNNLIDSLDALLAENELSGNSKNKKPVMHPIKLAVAHVDEHGAAPTIKDSGGKKDQKSTISHT